MKSYKTRLTVSNPFPSITDGVKVPPIFWIKINRWCENSKHLKKLVNKYLQSKQSVFTNRTTFK